MIKLAIIFKSKSTLNFTGNYNFRVLKFSYFYLKSLDLQIVFYFTLCLKYLIKIEPIVKPVIILDENIQIFK